MSRRPLTRPIGLLLVLTLGACGSPGKRVPATQADAGADAAGVVDTAVAGLDVGTPDRGAADVGTTGDGPTRDVPSAPAPSVRCLNGSVFGCPIELPACDDDSGNCVGCTSAFYCPGAAPVCDVAAKTCVECLADRDCHDGARPVCDVATKTCRGCTSSSACAARDMRLATCDVATGACVACTLACSGTTPTCEAGACRACRRDADCGGVAGTGVCLDDVGRCATSAEVLYVEDRPSCFADGAAHAGTGTAAAPFCDPQDAVTALTASRRVILLNGPEDVSGGALDLSFTAAPVFVVGQRNVRLTGFTPLEGVGVVVHAGDVSLRGFTVSGGGVLATGGTLRMSRMRVMDSIGEAIHTENASFDIVNTIIARNAQGAHLLQHPAGGPHRFAFNTSADNRNYGAYCDDPGDIVSASLVVNNAALLPLCPSDGVTPLLAPLFDVARDYHLTAASPCVDKAAGVADVPLEDVDGDLRPQGAASDCGADEFVP